jgi:hypothetical protein
MTANQTLDAAFHVRQHPRMVVSVSAWNRLRGTLFQQTARMESRAACSNKLLYFLQIVCS